MKILKANRSRGIGTASTLLALLLCLGVACGGDDQSFIKGDAMLRVDFGDLPSAEDGPGYVEMTGLPEREVRLMRIDYLQSLSVHARDMRRTVRDLADQVSDEESKLDLDWVRVVHELSFLADELQMEAFQLRIPDGLSEDYRMLQLAYLNGVQALGFGAGEVLDAAIILGPDDRSVGELSVSQRQELRSSLRKGEFFLIDADILFTGVLDATEDSIEDLQVGEGAVRRR